MSEPLSNDKHERFCQNLMLMPVWDPTAAYEQAGYKARGESARTAAYRLLQDDTVQARIRTLQEERAERTRITADLVLKELALLGFSNIDDYTVDEDGRVQLREGAHPDARRAVASVKRKVKTYQHQDEPVTEVDVEIKTWNKNSALDSMAKHLGMYGPKGTEDDPHHHRHELSAPSDEERARRLAELAKHVKDD